MTNEGNHLDQVIGLLKTGTDLKLLYNNSIEAEQALQYAKQLTVECNIPKPWPQLVNYRLAHVLMRRAKTKEDFQKIDELLAFAGRAECLGPLPRIYRIASMFRNGADINQLKIVFDKLLNQIDSYADNEDCPDRHDHLTDLQNSFFNMAELAAYFTGYPYEGLEGKGRKKGYTEKGWGGESLKNLGLTRGLLKSGNPYSDLFQETSGWQLVGTIPGLASTDYPGKIALEELENRMESGELKPPCVSFRISENSDIHEWNFNLNKGKAGKFNWQKVRRNSDHLKFLASIFHYQKSRTRGDLLVQMFDDCTLKEEHRLIKQKQRCAEAIAIRLQRLDNGQPFLHTEIFFDDTAANRAVPKFQTGISVLGAIDNKALL